MRAAWRAAASLALLALPAAAESAAAQVSVFVEKGPSVGGLAPDFTVPSVTADTLAAPGSFTLYKTRGQVVVLAFFPKVFMSGSDAELGRFRDQQASLFGDGVLVVALSSDVPAELGRYADFLRLPFVLLSDAGQAVGKRYGLVPRPGAPTRRGVFVVAKDGTVAYRDVRFEPASAAAMDRLKSAVQAARR